MNLLELTKNMLINEEMPRKGTKEREIFDKGSDIGPILGRYKKRMDFLKKQPSVFADEMIIRFPMFGKDKNKNEVYDTYKDFAKELAGFYKYLMDNPNIKLNTALRIYKFNKIKDLDVIKKMVTLVNELKKGKLKER